MPEFFKEFLLHKLTLRVIYIAAAFSTSHLVAFLSCDKVQAGLDHSGISVVITDPEALKTSITALMLIAGEFVYHLSHKKFVMPHVNKSEVQSL